MKKLLLSTAAICGLAVVASPAMAQVDLELGGWFKGYGAYVDQDEAAGREAREFDMVRHTEIHFGGETTLDNGLTVGMHFETEADGGNGMEVSESYAYMSGGWGRVNVGAEDGASYLLQVEAPSADANVDGLRPDVSAVNVDVATGVAAGTNTAIGISYAQDDVGYADKLTYLSPIMSGFQVGASYTPDASGNSVDFSVDEDNVDTAGAAYDVAVRYEGMFNNVGVIAGAGYTKIDNEDNAQAGDNTEWNAGVDLDIGAFGVGVAYAEDDAYDSADSEETMVVGVDYTTGPFKLGASYLDQDNTAGVANADAKRYTGGVVYTYGPGMTFRGSISQLDVDAATNYEATSVMVGTQINF